MLFLTPLQCLEVIKSSFQVILRGVFVFYTPGELCRKQRPWSKFCVVENRQELCRFLHSFSAQKSLKAVSSCFQVILRGVFIFYTAGGLCRKQRSWSKFCVIENRHELCCFLHSFSAQKSSKAVSSRFQVILRGVFIFYTPGGLCRKGRPRWSKFCIIEDIVVSYTSKVEIPVSRYLEVILRGVFVPGSQVLGFHFLPTQYSTASLASLAPLTTWNFITVQSNR